METGDLGPILKVRYYLGIQPPLKSFYFWFALFLCANLIWFYFHFNGYNQNSGHSSATIVLDNAALFTLVILLLLIIYEEFRKRKKFMSFIQDLTETDNLLYNEEAPVQNKILINYISLYVFIGGISYFTILEILEDFKIHAIFIVLSTHYFEAALISYSLMDVAILRRFGAQIEAVINLIKSNALHSSEKAVMLHDRISKQCHQFNDMQGWSNFSFVSYSFIESIMNTYFFFLSFFKNGKTDNVWIYWAGFRLLHIMQQLLTCTWVTQRNEEFRQSLQMKLNTMKYTVYEDTDTVLSYALMFREITFDAKGFFQLDSCIFLPVLSAAFTYLVMLLQTIDFYC